MDALMKRQNVQFREVTALKGLFI